jgi:hypothetical protein
MTGRGGGGGAEAESRVFNSVLAEGLVTGYNTKSMAPSLRMAFLNAVLEMGSMILLEAEAVAEGNDEARAGGTVVDEGNGREAMLDDTVEL